MIMAEPKSTSTEVVLPDPPKYNLPDELVRGRKIIDHFRDISWCAGLLNDQNIMIFHQLPRGGPLSDMFWTKTLGTSDTIRGTLTLANSQLAPSYPRVTSSITLYSFGSGIVGHQGRCHGGFISTLLDDAMGSYVNLLEDIEGQENEMHKKTSTFTLKIEVTYRKAVPAPGVILVRSKMQKVVRRKRVIAATLEDGKGDVLCEGKGEFLVIDKKTRRNQTFAKL